MQIVCNAVISPRLLITGACPIFRLKARRRTDDFLCVLQLHTVQIFMAHSEKIKRKFISMVHLCHLSSNVTVVIFTIL